jgi:xanthine dehydrogenase large subunit
MFKERDEVKKYKIYGVKVGEVEVELMNGKNKIMSVDIIEDEGERISKEVDVGKVEGEFVMGMG